MADQKQSNPTVMTPVGTLSFPNLWTPKAPVAGADERYSANLIFDAAAMKTDAFKALQKAIIDAAHKFFGDKLPASIHWPMRDAAEKEGQYAGYENGMKFIGAWTKSRPGVIGPKKEDLLEGDVFAGQLARFAVRPFGYNKGGNKGVGLALDAVQIAKLDMPRLDGRVADPRKVFDDIDSDDDGDEIPF